MSLFTFSTFQLPEVPNMVSGPKWERMKKSLVALLVSQRIKVFNAQGGASGKWKALSKSTRQVRQEKVNASNGKGLSRIRERKIKGRGEIKILQDSGLLRSSFTGVPFGSSGSEGLSHHEETIDTNEVSISTNVAYARIQNDGGNIVRTSGHTQVDGKTHFKASVITIPARPFDEFSEADKSDINELLELYLNG